MKVLVTGAAGFIGQLAVRALADARHDVVPLDVAFDRSWDGAERLSADITKPLPKVPGLDAVIHLAAMAVPRECDANPSRAFDVNVCGTLQVLKMAMESGARKVVFSSSAHVYGVGPKYLPTDETHPLTLGNTYTTTKILGEQLCELYHENHGLSYTTLRLFNVYGESQGRNYFIPDMMVKARDGVVHLSGANTTKDFVYVSDVARAIVLAVESPYVGAINIGTGVETSLGKVASRIAATYGAEFSCDPEDHNGSRMCANIARAKRVLGWEPAVSMEAGLDAVCGKSPALR